MKKHVFLLSLALLVVGTIYKLPLLSASVPDTQQKATAMPDRRQVAQANDITALAKGFVTLLAQENFATAVQNFDSTMKAQLSPGKLKATWQSITINLGKFDRQLGVRTEKFQQYDVAIVTCQFEKAPIDIRLIYNSNKQIAGLSFITKQTVAEYQLPAYAKLGAFQEKAVQIGAGASTLPGTLTVPVGKGPFPAIVLVHGSGPNDRDESFGPNKPFRDLALGLASQGIAVLRYDKRTKVYPQQMALLTNATVKEEVIDDAIAAVEMLRQTPGISPQKIFVLGHSLGGMLIPRIGKLDPKIGGLIVMAGNTRPFEDLFLAQESYLLADIVLTPEQKKQLAVFQEQVAIIKSPQLEKVPATAVLLGVHPPYWLDLRSYNPSAVAKQLNQPILILQGERDYQVTMEDFRGWQNALSGKSNVSFKSYSKLNHLFLAGEGKSMPDEYEIPSHIPQIVIQDIATWIQGQ